MKKRSRKRNRLVIGVTGGFGTGKSTVAAMFAGLGARLIDADALGHEIILPGTACYRKVVSLFGRGITGPGSRIDRKSLAELVFASPSRLQRLCKITHPVIIERLRRRIAKRGVTVIDAPLLIEAGLHKEADWLVVVRTRRQVQIARARARTGLSRKAVLERIASQMPLAEKVRRADFIIDNNGSKEKTRKQVEAVWKKMNSFCPGSARSRKAV